MNNQHASSSGIAVDVLLPYRNAATTLSACLESLAVQTLPTWRLIAVDDQSSDDSALMIEAFARRFPRIVRLSSPEPGLVAALNAGLKVAEAPLIARMDADDVMHPERLERQVAWLVGHPETGVIGCRVATEHPPGLRHYISWSNTLLDHEAIARARFIESPLIHPTVCFRHELIDRYGGYQTGDFPEDYELWLRWLDAGVRFAKVDAELLTWRDPPNRLTRTDPRYRVEAFFDIKAGYLARWLDRHSPFKRRVWVWGAGYETRRRVRRLRAHGIVLEGFIDVDPRKIGTSNQDGRVVAPEEAPGPEHGFVLAAVGSRGARELIAARLHALGYREGASFLAIA